MADLTDPTFWIPTAISFTALIITYVDMRRRLREEEKASKAMLELIAVMRQQMSVSGITSQQQVAIREREMKLKETMATIKTIKYLADAAKAIGLLDDTGD